MSALSPELRWLIAANLLGLAALVSYLLRRRLLLLVPALLLSPLPAFAFIRLTSAAAPASAQDQVMLGLTLSALSCYLPPALGVLTAVLLERPTPGAEAAASGGAGGASDASR